MIEGCLDWQEHGLAPPAAVTGATNAYLKSEDAVAAWIDECCARDANSWEARTDLFASWRLWTEGAGEYCGASKRFYQALAAEAGSAGARVASAAGARRVCRPPSHAVQHDQLGYETGLALLATIKETVVDDGSAGA